MRWVRITPEGLFYMGTTIALGVAALATANNILYLLVSMLLSGLGYSGYISWRTIRDLEIEIIRGSASVGSVAHDQIRLKNLSSRPLYLLEVFELHAKGMERVTQVQHLEASEERWVSTRQQFSQRGKHEWTGISVGTSVPFGFAVKYFPREEMGQRWIWPERKKARTQATLEELQERTRNPFVPRQRTEGEVRPLSEGDDLRGVVWTLSAKGQGWFVRPEKSDESDDDVFLDLRQRSGPVFESQVTLSAQPFYRALTGGMCPRLVVIGSEGKKTIRGAKRALDELAQVQAEGHDS